ncbi:MAG: hypothetical protein R3E31_30665, partial [Chloroflexota bacterium]
MKKFISVSSLSRKLLWVLFICLVGVLASRESAVGTEDTAVASWIVQGTAVADVIDAVAAVDGEIVRSLDVINAVAVALPDETAVARLTADTRVQRIWPNATVAKADAGTAPPLTYAPVDGWDSLNSSYFYLEDTLTCEGWWNT